MSRLNEVPNKSCFNNHPRQHATPSDDSSRRFIGSASDDSVVGLEHDMENLKMLLMSQTQELEIVPIVGMGGIGKTTLAERLYRDQQVVEYFHVRGQTIVSQHYDITKMLLNLLKSLNMTTEDQQKTNHTNELGHRLQTHLKGPKYLIFLDDIWSQDAWYDIKRCFPDYKNGSRIIVTTRDSSLATQAFPGSSLYPVSLLDPTQSWILLSNKVYCPPDLHKIGKEIVQRCKGLPLTIVVIAGILSKVDPTESQWKKILDNIHAKECRDVLALSYENLPPHLKPCFLYMGSFPEDDEIPVTKLVRWWISEGFLGAVKEKSLEEVAENYLEGLIDRNVISIAKKRIDGRIKTCKVHDLLRDLCQSEARKEMFLEDSIANLFQLSDSKNGPRRIVMTPKNKSNDDILLYFPRSNRTHTEYLPKPHKIHIVINDIFCLPWQPRYKFSRLRMLRVLDITGGRWWLDKRLFNETIRKNLLLRHLAFHAMVEPPASTWELKDLQTLVVDCYPNVEIVQCPPQFWEMTELRQLILKHSPFHLCHPPEEIKGNKDWALENLHILDGLDILCCTEAILRRAPNLKLLSIAQHRRLNQEYCDDFETKEICFRSLHHLPKLETLKTKFTWFARGCHRLPPSSHALPSMLKKLTYLPWEHMATLGTLPSLEVLKLKWHAFDGPEWEPATEGFPKLKYLLLEYLNLEQWKESESTFPTLECLIIRDCWFLSRIPVSVGDIITLRRIELHSCSPSARDSARDIQRYQLENQGIDSLEVSITQIQKTP